MNTETERRLNSMCNLSEVVLEQGKKEGRAEGIIEEKKKVAINMLKEKMSINVIQKVTGLSEKEIEEIKKEM